MTNTIYINKLRERRLFFLLSKYKNKLLVSGIKFKFLDDKKSVLFLTKSGEKLIINLDGIYDYNSKKLIIDTKDVKSVLIMIYSLRNIRNLKLSKSEREVLIKLFIMAWDLRRNFKKY